MQEIFSIAEGDFGKVCVMEVAHDLVTHAHSHMQINYWLGGGRAYSHVGGAVAAVSDGAISACNSFQSHDLVLENASEPVIILALYLNEFWIDGADHGWQSPIQFASAQIESTPEIREASTSLMRKVLSLAEVEGQSLQADVVKLLQLTVAQSKTKNTMATTPIRRRMPDYRLRLALSYMSENIADIHLMSHVAECVGISRSRLYELFFDEINSSPKVIWNSMRLEEAMRTIAIGEDSIASVAEVLGFSSAGNFSRFFKANAGISPLTYRKKTRTRQRRSRQLFSITYTSVAMQGLNQANLNEILETARRRNQLHHVTGVLLYSDGRFMQYLEGTLSDLHEILACVKSAKQHSALHFEEMMPIRSRTYQRWSMAFVVPQAAHLETIALSYDMKAFLTLARQWA